MEKIKNFLAHRIFKIIKWAFLVLFVLFLILIIGRVIYRYKESKIDEQIAKIHSTKITLDDVMGKNLPSDPGLETNKTVQGVDANKNGIRDDVELVIFKEYPNSAKTRAVLLQYALALQMEFIQPIVNTKTATEIIREQDRAGYCVGDILVPRKNPESFRSDEDVDKIFLFLKFVENRQFNTKERKNAMNIFMKNMRSYSDLEKKCDIDVLNLPN